MKMAMHELMVLGTQGCKHEPGSCRVLPWQSRAHALFWGLRVELKKEENNPTTRPDPNPLARVVPQLALLSKKSFG